MRNIFTVSKYTFIEIYRSKIIIGLLGLALSQVLICYVASEFAYGAPTKVALDFGLGLMSMTDMAIALFLGATLISKEMEMKTLYMVLSRPISRTSFLVGKILGVSFILLINTFLLTGMAVLIYKVFGGVLNPLIYWTGYFSFLESMIIMAFAILYSLISNITLSVFFSIVTVSVGHALNESLKAFVRKSSPDLSTVLNVLSSIIPNFEKLNLKDFVIYQQHLEWSFLWKTNLYAFCYFLALLFLISFIFERKNLD